MTPAVANALAFLIGYALGSVPFGIVLTRLTGGPDLRTVGSGNIGATNVLRTGKKWVAAGTLLGDMFKGTVAVLLAHWLLGPFAALIAGFGAFLGHLFPVWLKFKGGKGVATYIGVLLGLAWPFALLFGVVWLVVAGVSRYSSLSAIIASIAVQGALWLRGYGDTAALMSLLTLLLLFMHRANIARLLNGTEGKIKLRSS